MGFLVYKVNTHLLYFFPFLDSKSSLYELLQSRINESILWKRHRVVSTNH